jgi:hypothetical protein
VRLLSKFEFLSPARACAAVGNFYEKFTFTEYACMMLALAWLLLLLAIRCIIKINFQFNLEFFLLCFCSLLVRNLLVSSFVALLQHEPHDAAAC